MQSLQRCITKENLSGIVSKVFGKSNEGERGEAKTKRIGILSVFGRAKSRSKPKGFPGGKEKIQGQL